MPSAAEPSTLLLATRSEHKAAEIRRILGPLHTGRILSLDEAGIAASPAEDDVEVYDTFLGNAHAKARYFRTLTELPVLADDSGISVDALGGAPGVRSRRFSGRDELTGHDLDRANNRKLLDALEGRPAAQRAAHYTCAAVLLLPDGRRFSALGTCSGVILEEPRGDGGFGYDPLFLDPASGRSFGEMTAAEKMSRSHRARAFRALATTLPGSG